LRRGSHCMRYGAQVGFGIWVWKGQKRAAEPPRRVVSTAAYNRTSPEGRKRG
jgi:hypothetical protein